MPAASDGDVWLMSTPAGKRGFFRRVWDTGDGESWLRLKVPATERPRIKRPFPETERKVQEESKFRQEYLPSDAPKVVWLRRRTPPTSDAEFVLRRDAIRATEFAGEDESGILVPDRQSRLRSGFGIAAKPALQPPRGRAPRGHEQWIFVPNVSASRFPGRSR
jgi:hypothetical protein